MIGDPSLRTDGTPISSVWFSNLSVTYRPQGALEGLDVSLNVQNLFDKEPPPANFYGTAANTGQFGGFAAGDDVIGRYYTAGLRYHF
jgi:outer membrane receptor protein involved in Fe transport